MIEKRRSIVLSYIPMSKKILVLVFLFSLQSYTGFCDIKLPKLISDGAILQRNVSLTIWGWASPGEKVELSFKNEVYKAEADQDGKWEVVLPPQGEGGPYEMDFRGDNEILLKNILFGDVWLCSGQSNMELTMQRLKDTYP